MDAKTTQLKELLQGASVAELQEALGEAVSKDTMAVISTYFLADFARIINAKKAVVICKKDGRCELTFVN